MSRVALVLAAGAGMRFGGGKMTAWFRGEPLVRHAVAAARAAPVERVIVVCADRLPLAGWAEPGAPVEALTVASDSLSASLKAGVAASGALEGISGTVEGLFVFLGDMPLVPHRAAHALAARLGDGYAALPRHAGKPGHPVLFAPRAFADLMTLEGDHGAGALLRERDDVAFLDWPDDRVLRDIDRREDLMRLENGR